MTDSPLPTILAFAPGTWRYPQVYGSTRYHLWTLAELGWRVVYVEPPVAWNWQRRWWEAPDRPFFVISPGRVPPFGVRMAFTRWQGKLCRALTSRRMVKEASRALIEQQIQPDLFWFGAPWHSSISQRLDRRFPRVLHVYDELRESPAFSPKQRAMLTQWEDKLLGQVDLTLCSSKPQYERRVPLAKQTMLLENGIPDSFLPENRTAPDEETKRLLRSVEKLERPLYLYGGVADHRLDPAYFQTLADRILRGTVVIAGKLDPSLDPDFRRFLEKHPRVYLTGTVPHVAYPHLYDLADCLLLAHRRMPFTESMLPAKLHEYLASGKPIVSVPLPEVVRIAEEIGTNRAVFVVEAVDQFASKCTELANGNVLYDKTAGPSIAREKTWSRLATKLHRQLSPLIQNPAEPDNSRTDTPSRGPGSGQLP